MALPNGPSWRDWAFQGQRFAHHQAVTAEWQPFRLLEFESCGTKIAADRGDVAGLHVVRPVSGTCLWSHHDCNIHFTFAMAGSVALEGEGRDVFMQSAGDDFVTPPGMRTHYSEVPAKLELLEVSLRGDVQTTHDGR